MANGCSTPKWSHRFCPMAMYVHEDFGFMPKSCSLGFLGQTFASSPAWCKNREKETRSADLSSALAELKTSPHQTARPPCLDFCFMGVEGGGGRGEGESLIKPSLGLIWAPSPSLLPSPDHC